MLEIKIYYEDTDHGGVVYYANYLKYFERARTALFEERGINLVECHEKGVIFAVKKADIEYLRPARYGDTIVAHAAITRFSRIKIWFSHWIERKEMKTGEVTTLVKGEALLVCLNEKLKPHRIPQEIVSRL